MALQLLVTGLTVGCVYSLIALAFNVIYNGTGVINFSQGDLVMLGSLVGASLLVAFGLPPVVVLTTIALVALVALLVERAIVHPLLLGGSAKLGAVIISTMALGVAMRVGASLVWGRYKVYVPTLVTDTPLRFWGVSVRPQSILIFILTLAVAVGLNLFFHRTMIGTAMRATFIDRDAAALMGIDVSFVIMLCFVFSGGLSALAGIAVAPFLSAGPFMGGGIGLKGFVASVLGGIGSSQGAILGGLILGLSEAFIAGYISSGFVEAFVFLLFLVIMMVRPTGIMNVESAEL